MSSTLTQREEDIEYELVAEKLPSFWKKKGFFGLGVKRLHQFLTGGKSEKLLRRDSALS